MKPFQYFYHSFLFHAFRLLQLTPKIPFRLWVWAMQNKLEAASRINKAKHVEWDKEKV